MSPTKSNTSAASKSENNNLNDPIEILKNELNSEKERNEQLVSALKQKQLEFDTLGQKLEKVNEEKSELLTELATAYQFTDEIIGYLNHYRLLFRQERSRFEARLEEYKEAYNELFKDLTEIKLGYGGITNTLVSELEATLNSFLDEEPQNDDDQPKHDE